jgi:DNA-binding transcriptional LysR family regulator
MFEWGDIRIFMAVAAEGSTLRAARRLGLNQSTVSRRIQALEHALDLRLFERDTRGHSLTPQGSALIDVAGQMAAAAENVTLRAERVRRDLTGAIRISGAAMAMNSWGFDMIAKFRARHSEVNFDVDTSESQVSLQRGEADVALRAADEILGDTLVARKIGEVLWGIYGSRDYLLRHGMPRSIEDCADHDFLLYDESMSNRVQGLFWLGQNIEQTRVVQRVNSVSGMVGSLSASDALGALPCAIGNGTPDLVCCFVEQRMSHPLWIVASRESYAQPRVRAFMKFVAENIRMDVS